MSPHRQLSGSSARHPSQIQEVFIGMAFHLHPAKEDSKNNGEQDMEYSLVLHDGTGITESETFHYAFPAKGGDEKARDQAAKAFGGEIIHKVVELQKTKTMDIRLIAVAEPLPDELKDIQGMEFAATIWLHLDAIPFIVAPATAMFKKLPPVSTQSGATSAVQGAIKFLHPATHSATTAQTDPKDHHVLVDCDWHVRLCSLMQYRESTSEPLWTRFNALSRHLVHHKTTLAFFSATPQGGGVALMRHALIRLWRMVGLHVKWYTPEGHPAVFDITKKKIHNVLQGVAKEGEEMTDDDKKWFEGWTEENYEAFWQDGALDADIIVIDDPQLTALIPIIRKKRPEAKIIFRSHIQVQGKLVDDESTPQHRTWEYLFNFIKGADLFLAHPVREFVPEIVRKTMPVLYMPPSSDPMDGLNKPYGSASVDFFRQYFNSFARQQGGNEVDWDRGYICQIARFDPSKGIDVLLKAYLQFRQALEKIDVLPVNGGPQLIIMGHGSVDDPDGTVIYEQIHDTLGSDEYELVKNDVAVVRAPPSDSILGVMLQGAWVATQLSTSEGFEVKVTEAVNKRVPIIVSDAGGLPSQVKDGENGWIVPSGDATAVSDLLIDIYTGKKRVHRDLSTGKALEGDKTDPNSVAEAFVRDFERDMPQIKEDRGSTSEDFWTVGNAVKWMYLASKILGLGAESGGLVVDAQEKGPEEAEAEAKGQTEEERREVAKKDKAVLEAMGIKGGGWDVKKECMEENVWKLVMGQDLIKGEGFIREHQ